MPIYFWPGVACSDCTSGAKYVVSLGWAFVDCMVVLGVGEYEGYGV